MGLTAVLALLAAAPDSTQWLGPKPATEVRRVVTLAPSLTEAVLALGVGQRLVAVSRYDEAKEVVGLPRAGGFSDPAVEVAVALEPDLIVAQHAPGNQQAVEAMARAGLPVLALKLTSFEDVLRALTVLGKTLGRAEQASQLVERLVQVRAQVRERAVTRKPKRVLFVYGFSPLIVAGPGSFAAELVGDVGLVNVAQAAPTAYPVYSLERAVALAPDLIIDAADTPDGRDVVRALPPLAKATWVSLPSKKLLHPGPALADGLLELETLIAGP